MKDLKIIQIDTTWDPVEQEVVVTAVAADGSVWWFANELGCWQPYTMRTSPDEPR